MPVLFTNFLSKGKWVRCLGMVLIFMVLGCVRAEAITIREEEALSREVLKQVLERYQLVEDQWIVDYVNQVGKKILAGLHTMPFQYEFFVLKSDDYNAFAIPGGKIFIHSGLMLAMESESELAGILGHEIAHIVCRHISARIDRVPKMSVLSLAGLLAGALLAAKGEGEVAQALAISSIAAAQTMELAYSREDEMQADQVGLRLLTKAGYDGSGLLRVLHTIRNQQLFKPGQIPGYLLTHPAVDDRIVYLSSRMESQAGTLVKPAGSADHSYERIRMRLLALYGDELIAAAEFQAKLSEDKYNFIAHHGYGLALARSGRRKEAAVHLRKALEAKAFDPQILSDLGEVYVQDGLYKEALMVMEGAISLEPESMITLFYLGRARLELQLYDSAIEAFERLRRLNPRYHNLSYFLGEAFTKSGNLGQGHYYLGLYNLHKKDLKTAEFHFFRALQHELRAELRAEINDWLKEMGTGQPADVRGTGSGRRRNISRFYPSPHLTPVIPAKAGIQSLGMRIK